MACSPPPAPEHPAPPPAAVVVTADAAIDAPADGDVPDEVATAPAWIFRYNAPGRLETWTLRYRGEKGVVIVETARGTMRYVGTVTDAKTLTLTLAAGPNKLSLGCKREKLTVGAKCGAKVTKKIDVLDCYHPDFKSPMSFAAAPGVEFVTVDNCTGYRLLAE
jgi:hypothetical protein